MQDFQKRVIEERDELIEKIVKLENFSKGEIIKTLPKDEQVRLGDQYAAMKNYEQILSQRIAAFQHS